MLTNAIYFVCVAMASTLGSHFVLKLYRKAKDRIPEKEEEDDDDDDDDDDDEETEPKVKDTVKISIYVLYFILMISLSLLLFACIEFVVSRIIPALRDCLFTHVMVFMCILNYMALVMLYLASYNFKDDDVDRLYTVYLLSVCCASVSVCFIFDIIAA